MPGGSSFSNHGVIIRTDIASAWLHQPARLAALNTSSSIGPRTGRLDGILAEESDLGTTVLLEDTARHAPPLFCRREHCEEKLAATQRLGVLVLDRRLIVRHANGLRE